MKIRIFALLMILEIVSSTCLAQQVNISTKLITKLDTTFRLTIINHIDELERRGVRDSNDTFIIINIFPYISTANKISKTIIDSIYRKTVFPLSDTSPSYNVVVNSISSDCKAFNSILGYKYKYSAICENYQILIVSQLNIEFTNAKDENSIVVCSGPECTKDCDYKYYKYTTYVYHPTELLQSRFNTVWLKFPHSIIHPYNFMQK